MPNPSTLVLTAKIQDHKTGLEAIVFVSVSLNTSQNSCDRPTLYFPVIPDMYLLFLDNYTSFLAPPYLVSHPFTCIENINSLKQKYINENQLVNLFYLQWK